MVLLLSLEGGSWPGVKDKTIHARKATGFVE